MLLEGIMLVVELLWVDCMVVTLTENGGHRSTARDIGYALDTADMRNPRRELAIQLGQPLQADRYVHRFPRIRSGSSLLRAATPAAEAVNCVRDVLVQQQFSTLFV